ncbi:NAD(P)-dependent oxidoreductase [Reyranella soli]|uniref:3-beta hydroxysteroid dehydrogenase n=1 Tax=Reyranella soli TaxID=1230389 RepID=A0A512NHY8_9HYPH|nr:NAD(P)H-binding protein [Reyranella soli]GEP58532.1 3-beta hydroxysteroid dehydrogenase [Reyranella soli]
MNIVLAGATGNIGSRILDEALRRGHRVTGLTRDPAKLGARDGLQAKKANTTDVAAFADVLKGHDAAILSVKWNENDVHQVLDALRKAGIKRCLFVVGAGSLLRTDGRTHFDHMAEKGIQPSTSKPAALALAEVQKVADLDWTAISPPASIQPGERTGKFRLGRDHLLEDDKGKSEISREDFAIAIMDEIEKPTHIRQRFTAAY